MKRSLKCYRKGPSPKPGKRAPAKPNENSYPWWHDDTYNSSAIYAPIEDPDRYKASVVSDPPLRKYF